MLEDKFVLADMCGMISLFHECCSRYSPGRNEVEKWRYKEKNSSFTFAKKQHSSFLRNSERRKQTDDRGGLKKTDSV